MVRVIKCYYCGGYFDEEEAIGWDVCESCALVEEREYAWMNDEQEEWLLRSYAPSDYVTIKLAEDDDG